MISPRNPKLEVTKLEELPALLPRVTLFPEVDDISVEATVRRPVFEAELKVPVITFRTEVVETKGLGEFNIPEVRTGWKTTEQKPAWHSPSSSFVAKPVLRVETGFGCESKGFECNKCFAIFNNINNFKNHVMLHLDVVVVSPGDKQELQWRGFNTDIRLCKKRNSELVSEIMCIDLVKGLVENAMNLSK